MPFSDSALQECHEKLLSISGPMREHVYSMAKSRAQRELKVIVIFGAGRFAEFKQIMAGGFSYVAIDPEIDPEWLWTRATGVMTQQYDFNSSFESQVSTLSTTSTTVLCAKCTSEEFLNVTSAANIMGLRGIPAVFSFSISYHIPVINMLKSAAVPVFGCGYVHDDMPESGVGQKPVTMEPRGNTVIAIFGRSTWIEPFLGFNAVSGLSLMKEILPEVWENVDTELTAVMERAVILHA